MNKTELSIFSYGTSKHRPQSSFATFKAPFGSKVNTDFDAPDVNEELYQDDLHAPDIGKSITNIVQSKLWY